MPEKEIGKVIHFYNKIMVAVLSLNDSLRVGDKIKFSHQGGEFEQVVDSMEINHEKVAEAGVGDEVAIKTVAKAYDNMKVFKVSD